MESQEGPFLPVPFIFVYKTASNQVEFLTKVNIVNHVGRFFASLILRPHLNAEYALKAVVLVCSC